MVSGQLASWGTPGVGRWITVYANVDHVYMVVAGLRFDTRSNPPGVSGPRWHMARVDAKQTSSPGTRWDSRSSLPATTAAPAHFACQRKLSQL